MSSYVSKPIGGILRAEIAPVGGGDSYRMQLTEGRSSYTEEVISDKGILRVHHTLTLIMPHTEAAALRPRIPELLRTGVTARLATEALDDVLIGWTDKFGYEQPMRLTSMHIPTGARPTDGNEATLHFESDDTTALQEIL